MAQARITEEFRIAIRAAAARHCSIRNLARATGITERTFFAILNERDYVLEDTVDKFCTYASTDFQFYDLNWEREYEHGTTNAYKDGCRCTECRAARGLAQRRRKAILAIPSRWSRHGSYERALTGCKCDSCLERKEILESVGRLTSGGESARLTG